MTCCTTQPCYFPCDPPITAHDNEFGGSNWVRNFCKYPAKAGEKLLLTETLLKPGHMVIYSSFLIETPSKTSVPFTIGTDATPDKYGTGNMNLGIGVVGVGFYAASPADALITAETPVYVTIGADITEGILGVKFMLSDAKPMGSRFGGGSGM